MSNSNIDSAAALLVKSPPVKAINKPFANSYWVRPGRLLAGEYPVTRDDEESALRLQDLLLAGITCFINLTDADELPVYDGRLPARFGGKTVLHHRFTIPDHGVPAQTQQMTAILDVMDAALSAGDSVYVHCRAGIGRTGTVIGCHLVRHGYSGAEAIEALNTLWQTCARATSWPNIPETDEQEAFVRGFSELVLQQRSMTKPMEVAEQGRLNIYQGAMLGLAIGDVLGLALSSNAQADASELAANNSLAHMRWGSDTAMALALADSLLSCKQMQAEDQMQRYLAWQKHGKYSSDEGQPVSVPPLVQKALGLWQWKRNPLAGAHDPMVIDAHPLTRCAPVALYFAGNPLLAMQEAAESARTTVQAPLVLDACRVFSALLSDIIVGEPQPQLWQFNGAACKALRVGKLKPELLNLIDGGWRMALTQPAGDDVLSVLASAIHAVATTNNYQAAVFKASHKATRPAQVAAVCGAMAGALYGVQGLPIVWRETLPKAQELLRLSERLLNEMPVKLDK